jgi:hypothetical protein
MKFAKYTFRIAGIYGLIVLLPQYFIEAAEGLESPITHPEFYYGFIGVAVAFQLVFLIIGGDPIKYRLFILPSIVEKFSFALAVAFLYLSGRTAGQILAGAVIDAIIGVLFIICWFKISKSSQKK